MSRTTDPAVARRALAQRLRTAAAVLLDPSLPQPGRDPAQDAGMLLDAIVRRVHADPSPDSVWLLYVAVSTCLPTSDELQEVRRHLELSAVQESTLWLLDICMAAAAAGSPARELRLVTDQVVVDVDHSATHDLHTGIQQVVRNMIPLWERNHGVVLVAWTPGCGAQRILSEPEHDRVLRWGVARDRNGQRTDTDKLPLVVPWRSTLVLAEVPPADACARLAALAQYSGNVVSAIGYDCVPIVSADMVPFVEPNRFARYLSVIKHAHHVAGISISAATEFAGFAGALSTQGLAGPAVVECRLPAEGVRGDGRAAEPAGSTSRPTVLSVGSFEPRKNHLALLYAAERLWREGLSFRLRLIGGSGWGDEVPRRVRKLHGRYPITIERRVSNSELAAAYRAARFTVFPSLHEGYGLPVAESIAFGTPVITSNYGSTKEIGEGRGAELIDPRNDDELVDAMRRLLADDDRLTALQAETQRRPGRSWENYAADAWDCLVSADRAGIAADGGRR